MTNVSVRRGDSPTSTTVLVGEVGLLFSYETVVAFRLGHRWYASENVWSQTTGKHLNEVTDKKDRIPNDKFLRALDLVLGTISGTVDERLLSRVSRALQ